MTVDVYDEFDFIMQRVHLKMERVYDLGHEPVVLVLSRDLHVKFERAANNVPSIRMRGATLKDAIRGIFGLRLHVSSVLPEGSFMILNPEELDVILRYRDILSEGLCTLEPPDVNFDMSKYNKGLMNHKTNLLEGFDE